MSTHRSIPRLLCAPLVCLLVAFPALSPCWSAALAAESETPYAAEWQEAVEAYQSKDFARAEQLFEKAASEGHTSPDLFFNLGDTYYQLGQPGMAAWMWEKTLALAPRHADARHNLAVVRKSSGGSESTTFFMFWPVVWLWRRYTADEWALALGVLHALTALFAIGWIVLRDGGGRRFARAACLAGLGATLLCAAFFVPRLARAEWHRYGVVVEAGAVVRSAPGAEEPEYFEAPVGERLEVWEEPVRGWLRIKRPSDGRVGYLPESSIRRI
ncbi:hypothetical protein JW916_09535 [Candidatus Sumerlaeota bacterium]|nr:hypothetical protein [Candidatus Sumerlaeota bacterium]